MNTEFARTIASEVQLFQSIKQKENFLFLLGALLARVSCIFSIAESLTR